MSSRSRSSSALAWLGSYPQVSRALAAIRVYTHVSGDVLDAALRGAYWAAQRAAIPGVVAEQRRAQERRLRVLARLEEAATDALSLEDPIPAELAGHVHVARALLRGYVRDIAAPAGARAGGRRRGWRSEAERELAAMGIRRREARALLAAVAVRAREGRSEEHV